MTIPKYRAWHKQHQIMLPVLQIDLDPEYGGVFVENNDGSYCGCRLHMELWTWSDIELMQGFTINERTFYESDIVRYDVAGIQGTVIWEPFVASFLIVSPDKAGAFMPHGGWQVIGNIYEHPQLLQSEESQA